jgi:hypothetical protein
LADPADTRIFNKKPHLDAVCTPDVTRRIMRLAVASFWPAPNHKQSTDGDGERFRFEGSLEFGRVHREVDVRLEMNRCCERLHPQDVELMAGAETADARSEVAQAHESDLFGQGEERIDGSGPGGLGQVEERAGEVPRLIGRSEHGLAEANVPIAGREDPCVRVRRRVSSQDGAEALVVDELDH